MGLIEQGMQLLCAFHLGIFGSLEIQDMPIKIHFNNFAAVFLTDICYDLQSL